MTQEFKALKEAIEKKVRDGKRYKRSAGMKVIRKCFVVYEKSLDKSWWDRWLEKVGLK